MLRTTLSKIRHVCALAYFVPHILRGNIRYIPGRFEKLSVSVQRRVDKSTGSGSDSGSKEKRDSDYERCQRIIDYAFSPNPPHIYIPEKKTKYKNNLLHMVTPETPESKCEKCQRIIDKIFGEDSNASDKKKDIIDPVCIPLTELQATTAKENVETLAQKIEVVDETPLVEAAAKPKIEGFNVHPKVLGNRKKRRTGEKLSVLHYSSGKSEHGRRRGSSQKDSTFDELAKRCLDSPSGQIDERLLKEMEKLGVPPSSRRGSRKTSRDAGIIQPDIMRRPRRPVEKTELDFISIMKKLRELERLNNDLPPPFELISVKASREKSCDANENTLYEEKILPKYLTDQIESQPKKATKEEVSSSCFETHNEGPPQQLLGHMTATVVSNEAEVMADKSDDYDHWIIRQERLKPLQSYDDNTVESNNNREPGVVIRSSTDEEISLLKLKQIDLENAAITHEKLASTNLLSDMVDPNVISPQTKQSDFIKECNEIETLRNLLQTRFEHLTNSSVKTRQFKEYTTEFSNDSTLIKDSSPNKLYTSSIIDSSLNISTIKDSIPFIDSLPIKESSPINNSAHNMEEEEQESIKTLRVERVKPIYLKEVPNIVCKETSPHTEPGILIRETTNNTSMKETGNRNAIFRGYSPYQRAVSPHQLFEQISYISRETEIGTTDDYQEIDYTAPEKATPNQLLDKVGVALKDNKSSMQHKSVPENTIQNIASKEPDQPILKSYNKEISDHGSDDYEYANLVEHKDCAIKQSQKTLLLSNELSRRGLTEEETDEPVIAVEMGRFDSAPAQDKLIDPNLLFSTVNRETGQEKLADYNMPSSALNKEPVLKEIDGTDTLGSNNVRSKTLVNPILDQTTVPHVAPENINDNISANTIPKEHPPKPLTLSEMLKIVRERNRTEMYKEFVELQVDPIVGKCGDKKPPCPPPTPTCPPPPKAPSPQKKAPCPNPCKPKCAPPTTACPPPPGESKAKCPPPKKSPCDKYKKCCSNVKIQDALTLLLYLGPQLHIPQKSMLPLIAFALNLNISKQHSETKGMDRLSIKLQDLCCTVLSNNLKQNIDNLESLLAGSEGANYAKTYDPWTPIPSWPIPVKEEKRKLVCPKEGCKVIPPKLNAPCRDINPCAHLPRHNKYTVVSVVDYIIHKLIGKKVVYDVRES